MGRRDGELSESATSHTIDSNHREHLSRTTLDSFPSRAVQLSADHTAGDIYLPETQGEAHAA